MTNRLREAAQAALEALEDVPYISNKDDHQRLSEVTAKLRAALAEPEPVAWLYTNVQSGDMEASTDPDWFDDRRELWNSQPLYTHPPRRKWVPLTEPEMHTLDWPHSWQYDDVRAFCESVEAKLREMNS